MKFPERIKSTFTKLGLTLKVKDSTITAAEWDEVRAAYKAEFGTDLDADNADYKQSQNDAQLGRSVAALLSGEATPEANAEGGQENGEGEKTPETNQSQQSNEAVLQQLQAILTSNKSLEGQIQTMSKQATPDVAIAVGPTTVLVCGPGTTETHLFGIQTPMFAMTDRWNQVAHNPAYAAANPIIDQKSQERFFESMQEFGVSLSSRFRELHANGQLNPKTLKSLTFTTSDLSNAGLGNQYVVRRQDQLIARILEIPSVSALFNTRYNVQDRELITNAFFSELTQAFQTGSVFKGGMSLSPEFGHVDDLMIKIQFGSMKEIERMYIGYINTSGSDAIKWNMIEFAVLGLMTQAVNEYNERKILGIYVKPEENKPGSYMNAGTGVIYTLLRYLHENKMLAHDDETLGSYDKATFLSVAKDFVAEVLESVTAVGGNLTGYSINLNANHKTWWKECVRAAYGKETDFTGPDSYMNVVPDSEVTIRWIPNMKQLQFMWLDKPGNIQFLENVPGEIYALRMQEFMEQVLVWSNGKEGTTAAFVGKPFNTKAALIANNYAMQQIFINKPMVKLLADETTVDGTKGIIFGTIANTVATTLTDITGAQKGVAYIIECTATANASKIAKAGKFDSITEAYTPTAVGDYIMVILNTDGTKFLELERCVAGVRTINKDLQPNIPGAR